jgi:hypothetical protein
VYYLVYAEIPEPVSDPEFEAKSGTTFQFSSPSHIIHSPAIKYSLNLTTTWIIIA